MPHLLLSTEDFRRNARRRLPRIVFDYVDGGAETESTVRANRRAFESVTLRPRGGLDPATVDLSTQLLGERVAMPILLAPCGMARLVHPDGDLAAVRAAASAGTGHVLSAMSGHAVEEVAAAAGSAPLWFQVYRVSDRSQVEVAVDRCRGSGVRGLVFTIDSATGSLRERDHRNGTAALLGPSRLRAAPRFLRLCGSPGWLTRRIADGLRPTVANALDADGRPVPLAGRPQARGLTWDEIRTLRDRWDGPIVVKGVLTAEDTRRALEEGAAAVVVSNHGGRQLDGAEATLCVLPEVVAAAAGRCEVLIDGGIRTGADVLRALSLGAGGVLIGRPWLYGLAAGGEPGVRRVLQMFADSLRRNMALLGASRVGELDRSFVRAPAAWFEAPAPAVVREQA